MALHAQPADVLPLCRELVTTVRLDALGEYPAHLAMDAAREIEAALQEAAQR
jgi:hypothetical protein